MEKTAWFRKRECRTHQLEYPVRHLRQNPDRPFEQFVHVSSPHAILKTGPTDKKPATGRISTPPQAVRRTPTIPKPPSSAAATRAVHFASRLVSRRGTGFSAAAIRNGQNRSLPQKAQPLRPTNPPTYAFPNRFQTDKQNASVPPDNRLSDGIGCLEIAIPTQNHTGNTQMPSENPNGGIAMPPCNRRAALRIKLTFNILI